MKRGVWTVKEPLDVNNFTRVVNSVPWMRSFHMRPKELMRLNFDAVKPPDWYYAQKTRVFVRPLPKPWEDWVDVTVEGVSQPMEIIE